MADQLPLATLLSQVLVAFTIDVDNRLEAAVPHRTAKDRGLLSPEERRQRPWLISWVMWANFLRYVEDGMTLDDLKALAPQQGFAPALAGMTRWGYLREIDGVLRLTRAARGYCEVLPELPGEAEADWTSMFGSSVRELRATLAELSSQLELALPRFMPIIGHAMRMSPVDAGAPEPDDDLTALLSRPLMALTLDIERGRKVSRPMTANLLRLLNNSAARTRDLPARSGVSKEAISMMLGRMSAADIIRIEADPSTARAKLATLTDKGQFVLSAHLERETDVEKTWRQQFGTKLIDRLRKTLSELIGDESDSRLLPVLTSYDEGWRARRRGPHVLPHHPMVLHRGGYPDGA